MGFEDWLNSILYKLDVQYETSVGFYVEIRKNGVFINVGTLDCTWRRFGIMHEIRNLGLGLLILR